MTKKLSITIEREFRADDIAAFVLSAGAVGAITGIYLNDEDRYVSWAGPTASAAPPAEAPAPAPAPAKSKGKAKETAAPASPPADAKSAEQQATASAPSPSPAADSATPSDAAPVVTLTTIRAAVAAKIGASADNRAKVEALVSKAVPAGGEARLSNIPPADLPAFLAAVEAL